MNDTIVIDDELWEKLLDLTNGASAVCYQCGTCTAICPWGLVRKEPLLVRAFMRQAQLGLQSENVILSGAKNLDLWLCTTCAQCEASCPRGVKISDVFRGLRTIAWEQRAVEKGLPSLLWSVYWNNNPWSQPPSHRAQWAKHLDLPAFDASQHEILLYVGCTSSYDRRAQKIAQALVQLLRAAGVRFGFLGNDEPCCGEAALSVGHKPYFREIAANTAKVFSERGVTRLVTISPHCYDVFENHYPPSLSPWEREGGRGVGEVFHYTQYMAHLLSEGRLQFSTPTSAANNSQATTLPQSKTCGERQSSIASRTIQNLKSKITFQDPCYLGRHNGEYDAPRRVLSAIPGVELVEMANHHEDGLCCGGGGGRMWLETAPGERFSDLRVMEAAQTSANILATACPFCIVCLEDSAKVMKVEGLKVMDIAEIAAATLIASG